MVEGIGISGVIIGGRGDWYIWRRNCGRGDWCICVVIMVEFMFVEISPPIARM